MGMNILFRFIALFLITLAKLLGLTSLLTFASTLSKSVAAAQRLGRNIFINGSAVKNVIHSIQLKMQKGCRMVLASPNYVVMCGFRIIHNVNTDISLTQNGVQGKALV